MSRIVQLVYNHCRLGRPYYVLTVIAAAIAGNLSGSSLAELWANACIVGLVFLLLGMSCWAANEITDRRSDSRGSTKTQWGIYVSGGTGILSSGLVSLKSAVIYVVVLAVAGLAIAVLLGSAFWWLSALFLFIGLAYSVKPIRLKERGVLGLATVAAANGSVAFIAGWVATGQRPTGECLLFACTLSVACFGFDGLAHLLDHEQDRRNKETTITVSLGRETTRIVLAICQGLPALALVTASVLVRSAVPDINLFLLVPLLFCLAFGAALTAKSRDASLLSSLRVLSVPLMSGFAFLIV